MRDLETHHGSAADELARALAIAAAVCDQVRHGRADTHLEVARLGDRTSGDGDDARGQRATLENGVGDRSRGPDVLADDADPRRNGVGRDLLAGEDADELLLPAARVEGRDGADLGIAAHVRLGECEAHGFERLGLVVLDPDQDPRIAEQVMHDSHTREDISGALAHQQIVAGDVGLAFGPVDDQCADALIRAGVELDAGRKRGAAESDHAGPTDALANLGRVQLRVMGYRLGQLGPGVLAVGLDHGAERGEPGRVRDRMRLDRNQGSRARGMDTGADIAFGLRQQLSFENSVAHLRHRPRGRPDVLLQRDHEALGQRHDLHGAAVGERLLVGHMDPAVERPQAIAAQE